jgi:hypothetical protein
MFYMCESKATATTKRLIGRPQEALLCAIATNVLTARKRSAQAERKSTSRYAEEPAFLAFIPTYLFYIKGVCCLDEKSCIFGS